MCVCVCVCSAYPPRASVKSDLDFPWPQRFAGHAVSLDTVIVVEIFTTIFDVIELGFPQGVVARGGIPE